MKKILLISIVFIAGCGEQQSQKGLLSTVADGAWWVFKTTARGSAIAQKNPYSPNYYTSGLQLNAYGPGIHMNQYGQAVTLRPDFGGVTGEYLQIQEDAYGLGVHMDQYGRPVREYPWP